MRDQKEENKKNNLPALVATCTLYLNSVHFKRAPRICPSVFHLRLFPLPLCHEHVSSLKAFIFSGFGCKVFFFLLCRHRHSCTAILTGILSFQEPELQVVVECALPFLCRLTITVLHSFTQQTCISIHHHHRRHHQSRRLREGCKDVEKKNTKTFCGKM